VIQFVFTFEIYIGVVNTDGRITHQQMDKIKVRAAEKSFASVAVMIIKRLLILWYELTNFGPFST
jgi:hypothetical protein